ncbi:MFS transporter [Dentiradicibacter hellwigii]|uniref:MFS transporter n=1 Tax=Dentiradicibacter hellwigii TaxID=3149053 RepID=A0ABV4UCT8_9RHOO
MADRYGTRSLFAYAILGFIGASSVLCSLCHSLTQFAIVRFVQGIAGVMMVPVGRLAVLKNCDKRDLVNAIA